MMFLIFTASTILSAHPKYYIGDESNEINVNCDTGGPDVGNSIAEQEHQSEQSKIFDSADREGKSKSNFVDNVCHNQHKKFKHDEKDDKALDAHSSGNSNLSQNKENNGTTDFDNTKKIDSFVIVDPNEMENEAYPQSAYAYDAGDINKIIGDKLSQSKTANRMSNYESKLTAGSTMPNLIANEKSIVSFIQHISMLLQTIERESQKKKQAFLEPLGLKCNIPEAIVDSAHFKSNDNDDKGVNPDSTRSIKNEEEIKKPSKLVNSMYIHNESIINCQLDSVVQLYVPTHIQENCTIEDPIVTLQIPRNSSDLLTNDLKTYIWANNYFTSKTGMHHIANNVLIGRNNKLDSFYIGPFVTIGNGNHFKSVIIFANTTIQDCVTLGKNVIIGKNVTIKCGAMVEDNVIIEDNVTIGSGAMISKNVTIRRDSVVKDRVKICSDVIIGRFVTIYDRTEICTDVVIGDGSLIGKFCKIRDKVIVEPNTYIDGYSEIYNNVIVGGKMGSLNTIHYYVWIRADIGNLCKICNHVRLDNCEMQEAVCIKNNVIVKNGVKIMEDCRISNYVTLKEDTIVNRSTKIHDKVVIERGCNIGELNQIFNHTIIGVNFTSGNKCIIKDALIGDSVKIGSLNYIEGIVSKDVKIGDHNLIGSNCIIKEDCNIGDGNGLGCERPNMLCDQTTIPKLLTDCIVEPNCTIGDYNMLCSVRLAKNVHIHSDCVLLNGVHVKKGTFGNHSRVIPKLFHPQRQLMNLLLSDNNINHDFRSLVIEDVLYNQYYIVNADDECRKIISFMI